MTSSKKIINVNSAFTRISILILLVTITTLRLEARKIYSKQSAAWTAATSWVQNVVPVSGDTVIIKNGHTITVPGQLYNGSPAYLFLIVVGTLDLSSNGNVNLSSTAKIIIETGGKIVGNSNGDQITMGSGGSEYKGGDQGTITGPSYVADGHTPASNEGTAGCGCYTPGGIPLPIRLVNFNAATSDNSIELQWTTIKEENFDKFEIQRSHNGKNFISIGEIKGLGYDAIDIETLYEFKDESPFHGLNYYRLKAFDIDNTAEYFGVVVAKIDAGQTLSFTPNPSTGEVIYYEMNFVSGENDRIIITNQIGIEVYNSLLNGGTIKFDEKLKPGIYLVQYKGSTYKEVKRIVVNQ